MKTIVGMFWSVMAGLFLAVGVIVFTQLMGAGADLLGFTEWTYRYYMLCLGVCIALLIGSKPVRQYWGFMIIFLVAVLLVVGIGFQSFTGASYSEDAIAQMQETMSALALFAVKAVMYTAPGVLAAFYTFVAFEGVSHSRPAAMN
ncbi:hypothetical protein QZH44_30040 (plasmid) [Pseudomonas corrugata]|uniref:hypothetical protein n=1 Tax=Pseudomonas corrugata TaxID=47879 RepID=UPI003D819D60